MRRFATVPGIACAAALLASSAFAAPGSGGGPSAPGGAPSRDGGFPVRDQTPAFQVGGKVVDRGGAALGGVHVKMFANGILERSTQTDRDGEFDIEGNPQSGPKHTTTLWFEKPDSDLLPTGVILSLGSVADERHLFSACTPRLRFLGDLARIDVTMLTLAQRNDELSLTNCLGSAASP